MLKLLVIQGSQAVHEASVQPRRAGAASARGNWPNRRLRRLLLALPLSWTFVSASPAHALLLTWDVDNQASGNWYDQNWIGAGATGVPTADDDVLLPEGSQVILDRDAFSKSLAIESEGGRPSTTFRVLSGSLFTGDIHLDSEEAPASLIVYPGASIYGNDFSYAVGGDPFSEGVQIGGLMSVNSAFPVGDNTLFL